MYTFTMLLIQLNDLKHKIKYIGHKRTLPVISFINEAIPKQDIEKYNLRAINKSFAVGDLSYYWTVDRERDIYLRCVGNNWQEPEQQKISFYWKGNLLRFNLDISGEGTNGGEGVTIWSVTSIPKKTGYMTLPLPSELEKHRDSIVSDLKHALTAFKDFGVFSVTTSHTAKFNF